MAGITALGTTYNLPNYTGILYDLTPADTPFFSAIGGLSGGRQATSTEFEWEAYDLGTPGQNVALEGADAPTLEGRVRANITNVVQIQQRAIGVSYTKQAAFGLKSGSNNEETNPIRNELDWQTEQALKGMVRDANWSLLRGVYQKPSNNSTARQTRGLLNAVTTNVLNAGSAAAAVTFTVATNVVNLTAHGFVAGDQVVFDSIATTTGISNDTVYYVSGTVAANTFQIALTPGGAAIDLTGADGTGNVSKSATFATTNLDALLQLVFDNGGISEQTTATILVNSSQKRAISVAYANLYGKFQETSRTVGGVNVTTLVTDFGILNVMLERAMPQHKIAVVSMEQCAPVYLEIPGKGHMFMEPLAKTGATDKVQLYGEVGLAYGNEKAHGQLLGLKVT